MAKEKVNWHCGTLRKYESITSLGAKFCYLNRIKPADFFQFLAEHKLLSENLLTRRACQPAFETVFATLNVDERSVAKSLGERVAIVQSIALSPLIPDYEHSSAPKERLALIQYCPKCIAGGYHGNFHQLPWFKRCLIHGEPLLSIGTSTYQGRGVFDGQSNLITALHSLFFSEKSRWNFRHHSAWECRGQKHEYRNVNNYINWINRQEIRMLGTAKKNMCFCDFSANSEGIGQQVGNFLRMANSLFPGDADVISALTASQIKPRPFVAHYPLGPINRYKKNTGEHLFRQHDLDCLMYLRQTEVEFTGEYPLWKLHQDEIAKSMMQGHQICRTYVEKIDNEQRLSGGSRGSTFTDLDAICPRIHLTVMFLRNSPTFFLRDVGVEKFFQYHGNGVFYLGKEFLKRGITSRARSKIAREDVNKELREYDVSFWQLRSPWKEIVDIVLDYLVVGAAWLLFQLELAIPVDRELNIDLEVLLKYSTKPFPMMLLSASSEGAISVHIWEQVPPHLPDWKSLDSRQHQHESKIEEWANTCRTEMAKIWERFIF